MRGWLAAQDGDFDTGIASMNDAVTPAGAAFGPMYAVLIVEQELRAGYVERALARIERSIDDMNARATGSARPSCFARAAKHYGRKRGLTTQNATFAKLWRCRASNRAVRSNCAPPQVWRGCCADSARKAEARDLLAPVYGAFTEGFGRPDLQAAKALLAELN